MSAAPTGTVTFLFTDIEGSTRLAQQFPAAWLAAQVRHHAIVQEAIESQHGFAFRIVGDAFCAAFAIPSDALRAALRAQRALQAEPWGEAVVRVRMGLHTGAATLAAHGDYEGYLTLVRAQRIMSAAVGGQVLLSQEVYDLVRYDLPAGVNLRDRGAHRLKDLAAPEHLYQLAAPDLPSDFPPLKTADHPNNLPAQLTSFVGRESAVAEVRRLLSSTRLLTLTGSGGVGKTRLALQIAAEELAAFPDGVWFVELAPLADPALIASTIASAVGVREEPNRALLATLGDHFRVQTVLLVLDNCEHLIADSARVCDALLHAAPKLKILASSREALGIAGETAYRVPSLSIPAGTLAVDALAHVASVQLFDERAKAARTEFALTAATAPAVAQICRRLDGIPLAIELAAARVNALPVEKIAERLDDRFRLLTGGSRTALPRQQTLRALIDWSYNLLSEPERLLLQRLAVFAGGWTLEAAEKICAGEGIEQPDILDLLIRLADKSLIARHDLEQRSRYRMLETVRQYALEKLVASGRSDWIRDRHVQWFTGLAEETDPKLRGPQMVTALQVVDDDVDNIRTALGWAIEQRSENALRLVGALYWFWGYAGNVSEGLALSEHALTAMGVLPESGADAAFDLALTNAGPARIQVEARALITAGYLAFNLGELRIAEERARAAQARARAIDHLTLQEQALRGLGLVRLYQGNHREARALFEQYVRLARQGADQWELAFALYLLGDACALDDLTRAQACQEESLTLFRQVDDPYAITFPLNSLATLTSEQGDYTRARTLLEESIALRRKYSSSYMTGLAHNGLVEVMCRQHDYAGALPLCEEAVELCRQAGSKSAIAWALRNLATVSAGLGDVQRAEGLLRESLALNHEMGQQRDIVFVIESLAQTALEMGHPQRAVILAGAADAMRTALAARRTQYGQRVYEQTLTAARAQLGDAAVDAALAAGRALTTDQAIALAQQVIAEPSLAAEPQQIAATPNSLGLTARERDVLRLLAEGLSNEQIAERLVVSTYTVRAHLRAIYGKLDVGTRTAAVHAARARGWV